MVSNPTLATATFLKAEFLNILVEKTGMKKKDVETVRVRRGCLFEAHTWSIACSIMLAVMFVQVLSASLETITESVAAGKKVQFVGFGNFEGRDRKARIGRNPKTGEVNQNRRAVYLLPFFLVNLTSFSVPLMVQPQAIDIKANRAPCFSASKNFKDKCTEAM